MTDTTLDNMEVAAADQDEMDVLRGEVRAILDAEKKSQADLARESGVKYTTFTAWLSGNYAGNNDRVAGEVRRWLEARRSKAPIVASLPAVPGFQLTPTAETILSSLQWAKVAEDLVVVVGVPGVGKTTTFNHFAATNPNVWLVTLEPCTKGIHSVLVRLCDALGLPEKRPDRLSSAIGTFVRNKEGLIIIDEAQNASTEALDQIRVFPELHHCGVVLGGNFSIHTRIKGASSNFSQLSSRVGPPVRIPKPRSGDICALVKAWNITDGEMVRFLKTIGRKPGALRVVTKTIRFATLIANGAGEALGINHLKAAWSKLDPQTEE
jgi:DNA transposition AAA+ family ATPase